VFTHACVTWVVLCCCEAGGVVCGESRGCPLVGVMDPGGQRQRGGRDVGGRGTGAWGTGARASGGNWDGARGDKPGTGCMSNQLASPTQRHPDGLQEGRQLGPDSHDRPLTQLPSAPGACVPFTGMPLDPKLTPGVCCRLPPPPKQHSFPSPPGLQKCCQDSHR
jgi:hypothetical protein